MFLLFVLVLLLATPVGADQFCAPTGCPESTVDPNSQHGDGANCLAGEIALGVDSVGAVQGCYEPAFTDVTGAVTDAQVPDNITIAHRAAADCTTETGGVANEVCIDSTAGAGTGIWRCPAGGDCFTTTAWERIDDTTGGTGDDIRVAGVDAVDPNFQDTTTINVTADLVPAPDNITWDVQPNSLDFTEFAAAMSFDTDTSMALGDNETWTITGVDTGTDGPPETHIAVDFTLDAQASGGDTWTGLAITTTNNRAEADADTNSVMSITTVNTASNGDYSHILDITHNEDAGVDGPLGTLTSALRIRGTVASSMTFGIDLSAATGVLGAINLGLQPIYSNGILTIGNATDTDNIVFLSDADAGFVRIDGGTIEANFQGNLFQTAGDVADVGAVRMLNAGELGWERNPTGDDLTLGVQSDNSFVFDTAALAGASMLVRGPVNETIISLATITADACGSIKGIVSGGTVSTNATNTFTAPALANDGCIMEVCNLNGTFVITLDDNANFDPATAGDVPLSPNECITVGSTGAGGIWLELNQASGSGTGDITDVGDCATGACFTGASGTKLDSNTDLIFEIDADNDGAESFQVLDGAGANILELFESGLMTMQGVLDLNTNNIDAGDGNGIGLTVTATVCKTLEAADINCDSTNGCATVDTPGTIFDYTVATFDPNTDNFGAWTFPTPENISGLTFTAEILWTSDNAACNNVDTTDDVCWTVSAIGISNSDPWDTATLGGVEAIVDRCILNGDLMHSAPTVTNVTHGWIADEMAVVQISRDVDAGDADCAADAYPFNALLLSLKICYEVNNVFSGE